MIYINKYNKYNKYKYKYLKLKGGTDELITDELITDELIIDKLKKLIDDAIDNKSIYLSGLLIEDNILINYINFNIKSFEILNLYFLQREIIENKIYLKINIKQILNYIYMEIRKYPLFSLIGIIIENNNILFKILSNNINDLLGIKIELNINNYLLIITRFTIIIITNSILYKYYKYIEITCNIEHNSMNILSNYFYMNFTRVENSIQYSNDEYIYVYKLVNNNDIMDIIYKREYQLMYDPSRINTLWLLNIDSDNTIFKLCFSIPIIEDSIYRNFEYMDFMCKISDILDINKWSMMKFFQDGDAILIIYLININLIDTNDYTTIKSQDYNSNIYTNAILTNLITNIKSNIIIKQFCNDIIKITTTPNIDIKWSEKVNSPLICNFN